MKAYYIQKNIKKMYMTMTKGYLKDLFGKDINIHILYFIPSVKPFRKYKIKNYRKGDFTTKINDLLYQRKYLKGVLKYKQNYINYFTTSCFEFGRKIQLKFGAANLYIYDYFEKNLVLDLNKIRSLDKYQNLNNRYCDPNGYYFG